MPPKRKTRTSAIIDSADEDQTAAEPQYVDEQQEYHSEQDHATHEQQQPEEVRSVSPEPLPEKNDALSRARLIAAKLGPIANPEPHPQPQVSRDPPVVVLSDSPPYEPADERTPSPAPVPVVAPTRTRDRRSASPDRNAQQSRGYKRGRSTSRDRQQQPTRARRDNGPRGRQPDGPWNRQDDGPVTPGAGTPAVEFRVPADMVGLIIGRQGSNLKAVEQRHGVHVATAQNYDRRDPERTISIEGPLVNAENARDEILDFVARNADRSQGRPNSRRPPGQSSGPPPSGMSPQSPSFNYDRAPTSPPGMATVSVPSAKVGLIIGRGGESIREIQRVSGARVQVEPDDGCGSPERIVKVSGTPEQIEHARARIMEIVSPERSMRDAPFGQQQVFGGRGPQQHQQQPPLYGNPGGIPPAQPMYGAPAAMPEQHVEEMQVPAEAVGLVIGRGGENIKMIQQTTGARVNIIQDQDRSVPFRPVTITGDHAACMQARQMIDEKIASLQQRQSGGGYGGGRPGQFAQGSGSGPGRGAPQQQRQMSYGQPSGGYGGQQQYHQQQQQQQQPYQSQQAGNAAGAGGFASYGGYTGSEQRQQMPQPQQQQSYGQSAASASVAATGDQAYQWTNQQTADYYAQYASTSPEYAQYAEYYRKLAEKDPHGIVPSTN